MACAIVSRVLAPCTTTSKTISKQRDLVEKAIVKHRNRVKGVENVKLSVKLLSDEMILEGMDPAAKKCIVNALDDKLIQVRASESKASDDLKSTTCLSLVALLDWLRLQQNTLAPTEFILCLKWISRLADNVSHELSNVNVNVGVDSCRAS